MPSLPFLTTLSMLLNIQGKKRYALLFALGGCFTLALPPLFILPGAIIGLSGLLLLLERSTSAKQSFWSGWWFGLGHFSTGLYWFAHALLTDPEKFAWLIPFAVFGIPALLAFYIAFIALALHYVPQGKHQRLLSFAMLWVIAEGLRSVLFTGFPWNLTGYIWSFSVEMIQSASVFGVWGLSYISILILASPALLITAKNKPNPRARPTVITLFLCLAIMWGWGYHRLSSHPLAEPDETTRYVRIVQGNIAQPHKWDPTRQLKAFRTYLDMSAKPSTSPLSLIVWPETAVPFLLEDAGWVRDALGRVIPENAHLITGGLRAEHRYGELSIWNSLFALNDQGNIDSFYDKTHLVPFGEYVPFRTILPIDKITPGTVDISSGHGITTLSLPGIPTFSPLVCYEVIFPDAVISHEDPPELLINVTNDAWFGVSSGPYQHFYMARMRSVEYGIPLIRAANTGISAVVDSYGRIIAKSTLNARKNIDVPLPVAAGYSTIYHSYSYFPFIIFLFFTGLLVFYKNK